ncbi:hypothetical protein FRC19_000977 [Serendipita sp. 401]|nr:hypothetical protein FRC19_000977 [Serendipita sp. 401]
MASVLTERYPSTLPHHLHSPNTTITQLPLVTATPPTPAPPTPSAGSQQSQPSTTPGTTGTPLRSEKLLRDMLTKDVVARSRSLSRSSSSTAANHLQLQQQPASASASAPPLPLPTTTTNAVSSPSNKHGSVSGHSRSSSGTDDRPIFASTGIGGAPALVFRPHPTNASARRTIDGNGVPSPSLSPPLATRHHTSPLPLPLGVQVQSPPPPLLVHANSSPLIGARSRLPGATMGSGMGGGAGVDVEGDWYDEEWTVFIPSQTNITLVTTLATINP